MTEIVTRHRGGGRDENGQLIAAVSTQLSAIEVAPGNTVAGSRGTVDRARDGETIACTVYFEPGTDVVNSDELTVRGERYPIIVNGWLPDDGLGGLEVLCTRGQG